VLLIVFTLLYLSLTPVIKTIVMAIALVFAVRSSLFFIPNLVINEWPVFFVIDEQLAKTNL